LALASPGSVFAAKKMFVQATFNPTQTDQGVSVVITGRVFDTTNSSIPNAVISVQVNNPQGTSVHLAVAYTNPDGDFQDTFLIALSSPGGNYTAFLVVDKPGYDTARVAIILAYSSPDFSVQASVQTLSLQQGQTGTVSITILSLRGFNEPVNLTELDLPAGVTVQFNPASLTPSGTTTVNVATSWSAATGNYTITLLGVSGSVIHKVSFQLIITPGPFRLIFVLLAVILLIVVAFLIRTNRKRRRKEAAVEELIKQASADKGYVATARVIARLEELRAMSQVDEATYQRLKKEYEKRLEKSK
jgi:hypothetical protein